MIYTIRDSEYIYATIETSQPLKPRARAMVQDIIDEYKRKNKNWTAKDVVAHLHKYFDFKELELGDEFEL